MRWGIALERNVPALFAPGSHDGGDEGRIESKPLDRALRAGQLDAIDRGRLGAFAAPGAEDHSQEFPLAVPVPRNEQDSVPPDGEFAGFLRLGTMRVAEVVQPVDELRDRERLAST